jgi:hypothetical protein
MIAENGQDLGYVYGLRLYPAYAPSTAGVAVKLPRAMLSLDRTDEQVLTVHTNLKGETRQSIVSMDRPKVVIPFDGLDDSQIDLLRGLHRIGTSLFVVAMRKTERVRAFGSVIFEDPVGSGDSYCIVPPNSYTLASKRVVAAGGSTLLSNFNVSTGTDWWRNVQDLADNKFDSYDDATERVLLDAAQGPYTDGDRAFVTFDASGFLVRLLPGFNFSPTTGRVDVSRGAITFEGA